MSNNCWQLFLNMIMAQYFLRTTLTLQRSTLIISSLSSIYEGSLHHTLATASMALLFSEHSRPLLTLFHAEITSLSLLILSHSFYILSLAFSFSRALVTKQHTLGFTHFVHYLQLPTRAEIVLMVYAWYTGKCPKSRRQLSNHLLNSLLHK